jgi:hypothetical protein
VLLDADKHKYKKQEKQWEKELKQLLKV